MHQVPRRTKREVRQSWSRIRLIGVDEILKERQMKIASVTADALQTSCFVSSDIAIFDPGGPGDTHLT